jgi:predicted RND superfamily exporter protein
MWHRTAAFVIKYRIFLLAALLSVTVVMGYYAAQVEVSNDSKGAIPTDNPKYKEDSTFKATFGEGGNMIVIGVQTAHFFEPAFFKDYMALVGQLEKIKSVESVISIPTAITLLKDTANGKLKAQKLIADGTTLNVASFKQQFFNLPFYKGFLYNNQTNAYILALYIRQYNNLKLAERKHIVQQINTLSEAFGQKHQVEMHYSGLPYIRTQIATLVEKEMKMFLIISFGLTALILMLFFRSFVAVITSMIVVAVSVVWSVGSIVLFGYKITLLTALIPPLIVVIGIPNCVYFLNKYHAEYSRHGNKMKALLRMVDKMGIVTLLTNLTAAIGFGVFFFTKSTVLKEFGLVAGVNILGIFFISLIFIPALFSFLPPPKVKHTQYLENNWLNKVLATITYIVFHHRGKVYLLTVLLCIFAGIGVARLKNVAYLVDDLPPKEKVYQDMKFFEHHFRGIMPLEIVIDAGRKNGAVALPVLQKLSNLSAALQKHPEIGRQLSIAEGIKFANQAYNLGDSAYYIIPDQFGAIFLQPYLRMKGNDNSGLFGKLIHSFVDTARTQARISINMADVGSQKLPILLDSIRPQVYAVFDSSQYKVTFTGASIVFLEGSKFIINSLRDSLILAFIMIFGCMIFLFRSWRILLITVVVNIIPLLVTAGFMGWAGVPIKPSTVLIFSVALGITIDVTIRFLVNFKQDLAIHPGNIADSVQRTIRDTGMSIIYTSLILVAGFGVFALSRFDGTKALGYLTSMTLLLAMITNLTLQPALLLWIEKVLRKGKTPKWMREINEDE